MGTGWKIWFGLLELAALYGVVMITQLGKPPT